MTELYVESDIRSAKTISSAFYTDDDYFQRSRQKIFAKSWQMAGAVEDIDNLLPLNLLDGFFDEPILLSRDALNEIRCLSNVCTHRGKILIEEPCKSSRIRCEYHGRQFDLDGSFKSMPEFEDVNCFPGENENLTNIPLKMWRDFVFVSIDPTASFDKFFIEMDEKMAGFDFAALKFVSSKDYEVNAHWALYCENYLEGFHIPFVHKSLNEELDYGKYETETFRYSSLQTGYDDQAIIAAQYFFIFPNLMFNFYPWGISINIVKPLTKDLTKVSYMTFVNNESRLEVGAGTDLETVEFEDQAVVESVQKGIKSRFYDKGRYSPTREQGTHHFHRLICEFMNSNE